MSGRSVMLPIDQLADFEAQPFKVFDDDSMQELTESIRNVGVLVPIIVRRMENGRYEIISGHRRKRAGGSQRDSGNGHGA